MRFKIFIFIVVVTVIMFSSCYAPPYVYDPFPNPTEVVYWSAIRRLEWKDFVNRIAPNNPLTASEVFIRTQYDWNKPSGDYPPKFRAVCYVEKSLCWADKRYVNDNQLFYHQTLFDIYELFMRRMRQDFSKIYSFASSSQISSNVASIVRANENALNLTLQNYYRDTKRGANLTEVNRWSGDVFAQLKELESFKADTAFAP